MGSTDDPLPPVAHGYARIHKDKKAKSIVYQLYRWMADRRLAHAELQPWHVDRIVDRPFGKVLAPTTRYYYRGELLNYLDWLYAKGELAFDPNKLRRGKLQCRPLPELAEQFVAILATTLRPGTCRGYRAHLRRFCEWLGERDIAIKKLDREQVSQWLVALSQRGLGPATRAHTIVNVRSYLRWLYDRGLLERPAELLLRPTDVPKLPRYLPRPLEPAADRELQARLAASSCRYQQGLLLMRKTGLRIGELMGLAYDCVRTDLQANNYLKVPLGKLNNERLVPLDEATVALIEKLQREDPAERPWLLRSPTGLQSYHELYWRALRRACVGMAIDGRMTPHRLRHTYATSLLSGGMSLVGIMRLLGHLSYQTTLKYAAITQETIGREYFEALRQIEQQYGRKLQSSGPTNGAEQDPRQLLSDVSRWVYKHLAHEPGQQRAARRIIRRLERLEADIGRLMPPRAGQD